MRLGRKHWRLRAGLAIICALLIVLGGRLVQLQGVDAQGLALAAEQERVETVQLNALRGSIVDRNGTVLAYTTPAEDVVTDPTLIKAADRAEVAQKLTGLLGVPADQLVADLGQPGRYVVLATGLEPTVAKQVDALGLAGIFTEASSERVYPGGTTAADVIGLTHSDGEGSSGIEYAYNSLLSGSNGSLTYQLDANGDVNPAGVTKQTAAKNGGTVSLTIDQDLEFTIQGLLDKAVSSSGSRSGQVAVLDAKTGQVLALNASGSADGTDESDGSSNPTVQQVFEPGSVNKVVTFSAALGDGQVTPTTVVPTPDSIQINDVTVHDAWYHPITNFTATGILAESSNVGTLEVAQQLGPDAWMKQAQLLGEGQATGIELPGESPGLLPAQSDWSSSTFANLPIGQGVALTILQLADMYQAIANDGVRIPPRIVASTTSPEGITTKTTQPAGITTMTPQTATTLRTMLEATTQKGGTATSAAIPGYRISGKTGTAQQPDPDNGGAYSNSKYWATFAGMVPADNPQFVVAVMIDQPAGGQEGGTVATPLFKDVTTYLLQKYQVAPSGSTSPVQPLTAP
jgi:cell division protein FtsI (penicillin-binding protein 3)